MAGLLWSWPGTFCNHGMHGLFVYLTFLGIGPSVDFSHLSWLILLSHGESTGVHDVLESECTGTCLGGIWDTSPVSYQGTPRLPFD